MPTIRQLREDINDTLTFYDVAEVLSTIASLAFINISRLYGANFTKLYTSLDEINIFLNDNLTKDGVKKIHDGDIKKAVILVGSNLGFCGKFNNEIKYNYENTIGHLTDYDYVYLIGRQLFALSEHASKIPFPVAKTLAWLDLINIKEKMINDIISSMDEYQTNLEITIVSNGFNNITNKGFLSVRKFDYPLKVNFEKNNLIRKVGYYKTLKDVILEPEPEPFINNFLKYFFKNSFLNLLVQSEIVENFARMNAMNQAKDEIELILKALRRKLQKMRQAKITNELLEVIAGKKN